MPCSPNGKIPNCNWYGIREARSVIDAYCNFIWGLWACVWRGCLCPDGKGLRALLSPPEGGERGGLLSQNKPELENRWMREGGKK